jgi:hypothetical protein
MDGNGGGLICDIQDLGTAEWGCQGTNVGATGIIIGTGMQNTIDIELGCITANTAADKCTNSNAQGYTDWFLPSRDELVKIYQNKSIINATATVNGGIPFTGNDYWSSSENDNNQAWRVWLIDGGINTQNKNVSSFAVRAIRAF